jgi:uncharacterized protein YdaU (DUF1376 family)
LNYFELHIGDYDSATAHLSILEDGIYGRLLRLYYRTEIPIPADLPKTCRLVRAATKSERDAVQTVLGEFFTLDADGWHNARCDAEIERFVAGEPEREVKAANEKNRLQKHREERAALFKQLTDAGQHAVWNIPMGELRALVAKLGKPAATPAPTTTDTTAPPFPATAPATPATATQAPTPNTQYQEEGIQPPATPTVQPTAAVAARVDLVARFKAAGIFPSEVAYLDQLVDAGVQWDEISGFIPQALKASKPLRYVVGAVIGERERAATRVIPARSAALPQPESFRERDERLASERVAEATGGILAKRQPHQQPLEEVFDVTPRRLG